MGSLPAYVLSIAIRAGGLALSIFGPPIAPEEVQDPQGDMFDCTLEFVVGVSTLLVFDKEVCETRKNHVGCTKA